MASQIASAVSHTREAPRPEDPQAAQARAEFLKQLNLQGVAARAAQLQQSLDTIIAALVQHPDQVAWPDVLSKFSVVSLQFHQMLEQLQPVLKYSVVFPKAVNEQNAARLPLLLATKLLPDMEKVEAQMLAAQRTAGRGAPLSTQIPQLLEQVEAHNALVQQLAKADPAQPESGPLDPRGRHYKRLVQELKASFAPPPSRQLPSQMAGPQQRRSAGSALVAAVQRGEGLQQQQIVQR